MDKMRIIEALMPWNFWERDINTGIPREDYLKLITRYLTTDEIIAVKGIRRSGKSTILLQVLANLIKNKTPKKNTLYVNFEDPAFFNSLGLELLDKIWQAYVDYLKPDGRVYLVLDEIQKIKGWEHWVRAKYDRKENAKIFVTGSNAELLSSEYAAVLTGRHLQLFVTPLNFAEFLAFRGVDATTDKLQFLKKKNELRNLSLEYLKLGGFPKIVLTEDELVRKELLTQYFSDILTKDISERHGVKEVGKLKNLALYYVMNFTRGMTFNKVKKFAEFNLSLDSIHRFSHYLEDSFLIYFLPRFSYSLKDQMRLERKVFLADNGIHNEIAFKFSQDKGKLLENAVFGHLKRSFKEVFFFHEKKEVDFVCKKDMKVVKLINACYSLDNKETLFREISSLKEAMKYFKMKQAEIVVVEGDGREIEEDDCVISVIPFYEWALSHNACG